MKKIALFTLFAIPMLKAAECPPLASNQRDLVVLPDTAGEESIKLFGKYLINNFQTGHLEMIMRSQTVPILAETTIWKRFALKVKKEPREWLNINDYELYQFHAHVLVIPKAWKKKHPQTGFNLAQFKKMERPLQVLPTVLESLKGFIKSVGALINVYNSLVKSMRALLVYPTANDNIYHWNIALFGHGGPAFGSYSDRVAGIPIYEFKKLLRFLKNDINTNILLYSTCFAGSKWLLRVYDTNGSADLYPFPIVLTGITESPVYSGGRTHQLSNYGTFFDKIKTIPLCKTEQTELAKVAGLILQAIEYNPSTESYSIARINNLLQIRWQNSPKFNILNLSQLVQTAGKVAKGHPEKERKITAQAFVIDNPKIDSTIEFTRTDHQIASSISVKKHAIRSLIVPHQNARPMDIAKDLLSMFGTMRNQATDKTYFIGTVKAPQSDNAVLKDVVIAIEGKGMVHHVLPSGISKAVKKKNRISGSINGKKFILKEGDKTQ